MTVERTAAMVTTTAVLTAVIAGLLVVGSPQTQRLQRLDARRIEDLQRLADALDAYHARREALPETLEELVDGRRLSRLPTDPASEARYEYAVLDATRYRLCATFARASEPATSPPDFWQHEAGRTCFEFEAPAAVEREP